MAVQPWSMPLFVVLACSGAAAVAWVARPIPRRVRICLTATACAVLLALTAVAWWVSSGADNTYGQMIYLDALAVLVVILVIFLALAALLSRLARRRIPGAVARPRPKRFRRWMSVLAGIFGVLALILVVLVVAQRRLIYFPDGSDPGPAAQRSTLGSDVTLTTQDGLALHTWLFRPAGTPNGIAVLYAPGNGGNRLGRLEPAVAMANRGFTVLLLEYRGYGGNPGSPSENGLALDAVAGANYLTAQGFTPSRTIYLGESLGTGVVARLAATHPPAGVILRSPFTSLVDVAGADYPWLPARRFLRDRFDSVARLHDSPVPIVVLSGDADQLVPPSLSAALADQVGNLHTETVLKGVGHNDAIWFSPYLADVVAEFANSVIPR
ncbi:MAG TPA: alpha/beta hydrolase [Kineosporiaceae bacterium]|nr:alpha/beta hydrolase [Kineosporiaceae bacterium]